MRFNQLGSRTIVLSTGMTPKTTSAWIGLGAGYSKFTLQAERGTSVATSNFSVKLLGGLSTLSTAPLTLAQVTQATRIKQSTITATVTYVKWSSTTFTTAASRKLKIMMVCGG